MKSYVLDRDDGEAWWMFDSLDTIKADSDQTSDAFGVVEFLEFKGSGPPLHVHHRCEQGFYVLEGDLSFRLAGQRTRAGKGSWIFVPRGVPRGWYCESPRARVLSVIVPGGFEEFYRQVGDRVYERDNLPTPTEPDVQSLSEVAARFGVTIVGPPIGGLAD